MQYIVTWTETVSKKSSISSITLLIELPHLNLTDQQMEQIQLYYYT